MFSFLNIQTLHNDYSYIEHVHLIFCAHLINIFLVLYPPQTLFVVGVCGGYTIFTLSVRACVCASVRASVRNVLFP